MHSIYHTFAALSGVGATSTLLVRVRHPNSREDYPTVHTIQIATTGLPTTATLVFEGSLDGQTWFDLSGDIDLSGAGNADKMLHVINRTPRHIRFNLTALSGGSSPTVTVQYLGLP